MITESQIYFNAGKVDKAIAILEKTALADPDDFLVQFQLGVYHWARGQEGDQAKALSYYGNTILLGYNESKVYMNIAAIFTELRQYDTALKIYDELLDKDPENCEIMWRKGVVQLTMGNYIAGWENYDAGIGLMRCRPSLYQGDPDKLWTGKPVDHLVILHEQGMGDGLQFIRYAELCKKAGVKKVTYAGPKELHGIISTCPYVDAVTYYPPVADAYVYMLSLPRIFGTTVETIPWAGPYFSGVPALGVKKEGRLAVGLCWAGNPRKDDPTSRYIDKRRSIPFGKFRTFLDIGGIDFYSLQKGVTVEDARLRQIPLGDFTETASLILALDLIITVDTSIAHLAGALGKNVWMLSRYDACWRWLDNKEVTPWYPSMVVTGQEEPRDWDVIEEVKLNLRVIK